MKKPLISIILPTYNGNHNWLSKSIDSILSQSYKNFELIIINDASTNNIEETILKFKKKDKRIIYEKNQENLKLTKTLNKGIQISKGKYVTRIDDDDIWNDKNKLQKQVNFMEDNKEYGLCGTSTIIIDENGKEVNRVKMREDNNDIKNHFLLLNQFTHSSILIRKSILDKVGGCYNPKYNGAEDYELWLRLGKISKLYNLKDFCVKYRINGNGISQKNHFKQKWLGFILSIKYFRYYSNAFLSVGINFIKLLIPHKLYNILLSIYQKKMIIKKEKEIKNILKNKISLKLFIYFLLFRIKKIILLVKYGKFNGLRNIENNKKYDIKRKTFFSEGRKPGISGFARLKNADDFLYNTIETIIPYLDELILVDNNSTDKTQEICKRFEKKYPNKVKFYIYEPEVYKLGTKQYSSVKNNSIYNMAYYYNWCLSKTTYSHAIKVDDDNFFIKEEIKDIFNNYNKNKFNILPGINIFPKEKIFLIPEEYPFAGLYGDFGIFKVSTKTYFIKSKNCEDFIHPYGFKIFPMCFFHLKYLKKDYGFFNYDKSIKENYITKIKNSLISISGRYKKYIEKYKQKFISKMY